MEASTYQQIQELSRMTVGQLREKYLDVFGEESRCHHKAALRKRIAWRLQALAEGGPTPPIGDITWAASPMQSSPGWCHRLSRSTATVSSLTSFQLAIS